MVDHVRGEGVVGEYPVMSQDSREFSYTSVCTGRELAVPASEDSDETVYIHDPVVSMEGEFEFMIPSAYNAPEERFEVPIMPFYMPQPRALFPQETHQVPSVGE